MIFLYSFLRDIYLFMPYTKGGNLMKYLLIINESIRAITGLLAEINKSIRLLILYLIFKQIGS